MRGWDISHFVNSNAKWICVLYFSGTQDKCDKRFNSKKNVDSLRVCDTRTGVFGCRSHGMSDLSYLSDVELTSTENLGWCQTYLIYHVESRLRDKSCAMILPNDFTTPEEAIDVRQSETVIFHNSEHTFVNKPSVIHGTRHEIIISPNCDEKLHIVLYPIQI